MPRQRTPGGTAVFTWIAMGVVTAVPPAGSAQEAIRSIHGDWQIRCETPAGSPAEQCALYQSVVAEDRPSVGLTVMVFKSATPQARLLRVRVPLGIYLPTDCGSRSTMRTSVGSVSCAAWRPAASSKCPSTTPSLTGCEMGRPPPSSCSKTRRKGLVFRSASTASARATTSCRERPATMPHLNVPFGAGRPPGSWEPRQAIRSMRGWIAGQASMTISEALYSVRPAPAGDVGQPCRPR